MPSPHSRTGSVITIEAEPLPRLAHHYLVDATLMMDEAR